MDPLDGEKAVKAESVAAPVCGHRCSSDRLLAPFQVSLAAGFCRYRACRLQPAAAHVCGRLHQRRRHAVRPGQWLAAAGAVPAPAGRAGPAAQLRPPAVGPSVGAAGRRQPGGTHCRPLPALLQRLPAGLLLSLQQLRPAAAHAGPARVRLPHAANTPAQLSSEAGPLRRRGRRCRRRREEATRQEEGADARVGRLDGQQEAGTPAGHHSRQWV